MQIPNFASEQPGATYYYSAMNNAYVFGVVDGSVDCLSAYVYCEDVAKKGGNNVASLLMYNLQRQGIMQQSSTEPFKELNFIMDNCGGQNKNRQVLRMLHFIVKQRIAVKASAIFLVRGHSKNDCERRFNTMKKEYRKTNCYTPKDLIESMRNEKVDPVPIAHDVFKDWDTLEEVYIKRPVGETNHNHIFTVDINRDNGNTMYMKESDKAPVEVPMVLVKRQYLKRDAAFWKELQPEAIDPVGIQDIKWRELYKKWGPYVPQDKRKEWRYYHEAPPAAAALKEVAEHTKEAREQRKSRSRTIVDEDGNKKVAAKPSKKKKTTTTTTKEPTTTADNDGNNTKKKRKRKKKTKDDAAKPPKKKSKTAKDGSTGQSDNVQQQSGGI
jgi:hypothetical protein